MSVGQILQVTGFVIGVCCAFSVALIVLAKLRRGRAGVRSGALLAPYRRALIAVASGEDDDGQAKAALEAVPAPTWGRLRASVLAFLPKVRGAPAEDLSELLRSHGDIEGALRRLTSQSGARRARAVYAAVLENVGYRQATAWWRLEGWWDHDPARLRRRDPAGERSAWGGVDD